jgi:Tol biopolymer transport system component/serine/threonine protein kinase
MIGKTLSHFRILAKIGEGGMGVVYRAEDESLKRPVALKVLPPGLVGNEERRMRFVREARAAAAATHPNIATIYEAGEADGLVFIAMELVEGKALSALIGGRPLPMRDALRIDVEIAEGLARAHQCQVIHRDLKPENVIVGADGQAKILDFGLAKLLEKQSEKARGRGSAGARDPEAAGTGAAGESELSRLGTISGEMTRAGRILGTAAYMSPEQARGQPVDARSDIFSFGSTLYEMVTGRVPFRGKTAIDTLSAIIRDEPVPPAQINADVPVELERIIGKCLEKVPEERYQDSRDLAVDLKHLKRTTDSQAVSRPAPGSGATRARAPMRLGRRWMLVAVAAGAAAIGITSWLLSHRGGGGEKSRAPISVTFTQITHQPGVETAPSLSPDGKSVVYASLVAGNADIFHLRVGGSNAVNLTADSPANDTSPAFSPDGERIVFRSEREGGGIFIMGATGESVRRLVDFGYDPAWSPDGKSIVFSTEEISDPQARQGTGQLWVADVATGRTKQISAGDAVQPHWSPGGHRIAYWVNKGGQRDLWTMAAAGGGELQVTNDPALDWDPVWSPDGAYLYFSSDRGGSVNLWRMPIQERSGTVLGPPEPITAPASYAAHLSFSSDGRRGAFASIQRSGSIQRVPFNAATGTVEGGGVPVVRGSRLLIWPDVSPDGSRLALHSWGNQEDIFVSGADGSGLRQLTDDLHKDRAPRWSPDGRQIAFYSNRSGTWQVWTINADGADLVQRTFCDGGCYHPGWSPDGSRMAYWDEALKVVTIFEPAKAWKDHKPATLPPPEESLEAAEDLYWSPDGKYIELAYLRAGGAADGVAVYSFKTRTFVRLIDRGGAPRWLDDSRRLLFVDDGKLHLFDMATRQRRELLSLQPPAALENVAISRDNRWSTWTSERKRPTYG